MEEQIRVNFFLLLFSYVIFIHVYETLLDVHFNVILVLSEATSWSLTLLSMVTCFQKTGFLSNKFPKNNSVKLARSLDVTRNWVIIYTLCFTNRQTRGGQHGST